MAVSQWGTLYGGSSKHLDFSAQWPHNEILDFFLWLRWISDQGCWFVRNNVTLCSVEHAQYHHSVIQSHWAESLYSSQADIMAVFVCVDLLLVKQSLSNNLLVSVIVKTWSFFSTSWGVVCDKCPATSSSIYLEAWTMWPCPVWFCFLSVCWEEEHCNCLCWWWVVLCYDRITIRWRFNQGFPWYWHCPFCQAKISPDLGCLDKVYCGNSWAVFFLLHFLPKTTPLQKPLKESLHPRPSTTMLSLENCYTYPTTLTLSFFSFLSVLIIHSSQLVVMNLFSISLGIISKVSWTKCLSCHSKPLPRLTFILM